MLGLENFSCVTVIFHFSFGSSEKGEKVEKMCVSVALLAKKFKSPTTPHMHQVSQVSHPRQPSGDVRRAQELNIKKRGIHVVEIKYCEDTRPGHQL